MKKQTKLLLILCMIISLLMPVSISAAESENEPSKPEFEKLTDLKGKTFGLLTGAPFEELIRQKVGKVKKFMYFSSIADEELALKQGKIDAFLTSNAVAGYAANSDPELAEMKEEVSKCDYGFAFTKGNPDVAKWQKACDTITEKEKKALWDKWLSASDEDKSIPEQDWPGEAGTVKVAACDTMQPMSYVTGDDDLIGFDIEMLLLVAKKLDVHLDFTGMEFSTLMSDVQANKAEVGAGGIFITDERKEMVDFVDYYPAAYSLVVRSDKAGSMNEGFFSGLASSFKRTFLEEDRYEMVLSGLGATVIISVGAAVFGLLLAYALVFLRHKNNMIINGIIRVYTSLVAGIPAVVILMILYYIVLNALNLSAVPVAVIGFTLIFAARAYEVIWNAVVAVDPGQREAALALGFTENKAFREIILPQSKSMYFNLLKGQFITLVKETSMAGYITVLELTRAGDLIRSRTMEAFFPLIAVAIIYFLLTRIFVWIINMIQKSFDRKHNSRKVKGVDA